jgi:hypothetical protein
MEKLRELKKKGWVASTKESIDAFLDTWSGMFELTSRTAAYALFREHYHKKNLAENMPAAEAYRAACEQAAADTKNLTNFEKVGTYGRELGGCICLFAHLQSVPHEPLKQLHLHLPPSHGQRRICLRWCRMIQKPKKSTSKTLKFFVRNSQIMVVGLTGFWVCHIFDGNDDGSR